MKIYINKLNLTILPDVHLMLRKHLLKSEQYIELLTNEGIYRIYSSTIEQCIPKDAPIHLHKNYYNEFELIVDESTYDVQQVTSIHGDKHLQQHVTKYTYKTGHSHLFFVIELSEDDATKERMGKDCYFETTSLADIQEIFIKQTIIEFLCELT